MLKTHKDKLLEFAYLACFAVYSALSLCAFSPIGERIQPFITQKQLFTLINWCAIAVLAVIYVLKHHESKKEVIAEILLAALFAVVSFTNQTVSSVFSLSQWTMFIAIGMFIICATVTNFKRLTIVSTVTSLLMFVIFNCAYLFGFITDTVTERFGKAVHYMGYYYYSHPSYYMLCIWLAYMYLRGEKQIGWIELCAELGAMYLLYYHTTCRLGFVCACVAFILYVIIVKLNLINLNWKITKFASAAGFGAAALFTLLCGYFYSPSNILLEKLNSAINGRIYLTNVAFDRYDINLFGRLITFMEDGSYFYLDSAYTYSLFGCGVIFFIVVIAMYSYMYYYSCKTNNKPLFVWLTTLAIFGIVGDIWVNIAYTPLILGFFIMHRDRKRIFGKGDNDALKSPDNL